VRPTLKCGVRPGACTITNCRRKYVGAHAHFNTHAHRYWEDLGQDERAKLLKDRLKVYTQKVGEPPHSCVCVRAHAKTVS